MVKWNKYEEIKPKWRVNPKKRQTLREQSGGRKASVNTAVKPKKTSNSTERTSSVWEQRLEFVRTLGTATHSAVTTTDFLATIPTNSRNGSQQRGRKSIWIPSERTPDPDNGRLTGTNGLGSSNKLNRRLKVVKLPLKKLAEPKFSVRDILLIVVLYAVGYWIWSHLSINVTWR